MNAAKGPDNLGCPSPDSCASTLYGCCPDGITVAKGEKFVGCDFVPAHECLTSEYGCCPDGTKSAEGSGYEGCSLEDEITATITDAPVIDDIGSGLDCSDSLHGCCADGITQALGPDQEGCPENITSPATPTPTGVTILDCEAGPFGCCPDNITFALGSNGEGCETPTSEAPTSETLQAIDETDPTPIALDCDSSVFGCCSDGLTSGRTKIPEFLHFFGCCD